MIPPHMNGFGELAGSMSRSVHGTASTFTQIVSEQVGMSVPHVELADRARLDHCLSGLDGCLYGVAQRMRTASGCSAEAMLVLSQGGGLVLVRRMLGLPDDVAGPGELEQDALAEVGNIVIDACSGVLGWHIEAAQPRVTLSVPDHLLGVGDPPHSALVTHLHMHLSGLRVDGLVVLKMDAVAGVPRLPPRRLDA